jgi:fatty-acyl-CoA synthase
MVRGEEMAVTAWLSAPRPGRGVRLARDGGGWDLVEYSALATAAARVAASLAERGARPGDVVAIALPASRDGLAALFGTWAAGCVACLLPAPGYASGPEYTAHVAAILRQARPVVTFGDADADALLSGVAPVRPVEYARLPLAPEAGGWAGRTGVAAVQFTSGSTRQPRGIQLTWDNIAANIAVITRWCGWRDDDGVASWLPLNHDMGFIGCLLTAVARQGDLWLMRPDQFIREPGRWLSCLGHGGASHTAAPPFGYGYAARRVPPTQWAGLDLSGWRTAIVGAEAIDIDALRSFTAAAQGSGFSPGSFRPAYGLAENTVAVTAGAGAGGRAARVLRPDWRRMRFGSPVPVLETGDMFPGALGSAGAGSAGAGPGGAGPAGAGWLAGHGMPAAADGIGVCIADDDGAPLPAGTLGEIVVSGTSVAAGYLGEAPWDGTLRTGDAGFVYDGDLYVLGRMGDSLKLRARSVYVEDLEVKAKAAAGFDRLTVVGVTDGGAPGVAVFGEAEAGPWAGQVTETLRAELGPEPEIVVIAGPRGLIRRTSSGKPRRREMWRLWSAGELGGTRLPMEPPADNWSRRLPRSEDFLVEDRCGRLLHFRGNPDRVLDVVI